MAGGTAAAQVITLAVSPILTRQYGPETFGMVGILLAIITPLAALVDGKYQMAVVLPPREQDAIRLMKAGYIIVPFVSLAIFLGLWLLRERIAVWTDFPLFAKYLWFIPVTVMLGGYLGIINYWIIRKKRFNVFSTSSPISVAGGSLYKIIQGFYAGSVLSMLLGNILTQLIQLSMFLRTLPKKGEPQEQTELPRISTGALLKRYADFPLYRAPQVFLNALAANVPSILFATFYSPVAVGQYWLAQRVIAAPATLICDAVLKVFYQKSTEVANSGESIYAEIRQKASILLLVGIPIFSTLALLCPFVFGFIFGEQWSESGRIASWVAIWYLSIFINAPAVSSIPVLNLQKHFLAIEIVAACLRIGVVVFAGSRYSFMATVAALSISGFVVNVFILFFTLYHAKHKVVYR